MSPIKKRGLNALFYFFTAFLLIFWLGCGPQEKNTNCVSKDTDLPSTRDSKSHKELLITIFPQDQEKVRKIEKPIQVYFSYQVEPKNFSYKLSPEAGDLSVSWGMKNRSVSLNHSEPFEIGQSYHFEAEIRLKKEKIFSESVEFTVVGPSSLQLISKDQEKGLLDVDQAWTYRLQALFEPHLLPSEYQILPLSDAALL